MMAGPPVFSAYISNWPVAVVVTGGVVTGGALVAEKVAVFVAVVPGTVPGGNLTWNLRMPVLPAGRGSTNVQVTVWVPASYP